MGLNAKYFWDNGLPFKNTFTPFEVTISSPNNDISQLTIWMDPKFYNEFNLDTIKNSNPINIHIEKLDGTLILWIDTINFYIRLSKIPLYFLEKINQHKANIDLLSEDRKNIITRFPV